MSQFVIDEETLTAIADAIRENAPNSCEGNMTPQEMAAFIPDVRSEAYQEAYDEIDGEVSTQSDLISQIKAKANSLPSAGSGGASGNVYSGTVTSNSNGYVTIPMPSFEPKQIMLWNVSVIDQHEETGDNSLVRYLCDGVMLCAVWSPEYGYWVAQYMCTGSGTVYIAQASAERGDLLSQDQDYGNTNIMPYGDSIVWNLGGDLYTDDVNDITEVTFNYVITG